MEEVVIMKHVKDVHSRVHFVIHSGSTKLLHSGGLHKLLKIVFTLKSGLLVYKKWVAN